MSGFEVRNDRGEVIVSSDIKMFTEVARQAITTVNGWYRQQSPIIDKPIGVAGLPDLGIPNLLTLLDFSKTGGSVCGCGNVYYSANAGSLVHLSGDALPESGFLDIHNEDGHLVWSAKTAGKVPRISRVVHLTYAQLTASASFNIASGELMMLNHLVAYQLPGAGNHGGAKHGGLYWKKSGNVMTFHAADYSNNVEDGLRDAYGDYGIDLYFYKFADS